MSDKSLMDRWCWMMKIAPHDNRTFDQNSWSEKSKNLLSTEKKVYAIKVTECDHKAIDSDHQLITVRKKKKRISSLKNWIEKCQWKLPKAMILFSVLQVRIYFDVAQNISLILSLSAKYALLIT